MTNVKDMTGQRFGRLLVESKSENSASGKARWLCKCDCGEERVIPRSQLIEGRTNSCGCYRRERASGLNLTHGRRNTPEYRSWLSMKNRCQDESHVAYARYGGRGIQVYPSWRDSFEAFFADMGPRPAGTTLDRIDSDGNYEPGNCQWATAKAQAANRKQTGGVNGPRGDTHPDAKLNAESVREIRQLHAQGGWTVADLAARFGVHPTSVGQMLRGRTWKHVT